MRRIALLVTTLCIAALTGCGGGSSGPTAPLSLTQMRGSIKQSVDAKLTKLGRPTKEIACIDRNIDSMTAKQIAERLVQSAPVGLAPKEELKAIVGPLGRGCP